MPSTVSRTKTLTSNSTWVYFSKLFTQLLSLVVSVLVIRKLSVEIFGTYNLLLNTFIIFNLFAISPINSVLSRYIPELLQKNDLVKLKSFIIKAFIISGTVIALLLVVINFWHDEFARFFNIYDFENYLTPFLIFVIASFLKEVSLVVISAMLLHKKSSLLTIANSIITSVLYIYFLSSLSVEVILNIESAMAIAYFLIMIIVIWIYLSNLEERIVQQNSDVTRKRVLRYGLYSSFNELGAGIVGKTSDYFIISAISNQYYVGLYAFAYKLYSMLYSALPLKDFLSVLRPLFIQKFSQGYDKEEYITVFNFIIKVMLPVYLFPAIYLFVFGRAFITYVFDIKYLEAYSVTCIIMFSNISIAFFFPQGLTVILKERMDIALYSKIVVVFSIIAGIFSMKYWGITGVAAVTMIGDITRNLIMHYLMRAKADMVYRLNEMKNYVFITGGMMLFYFSQYFINNLITLTILSILFLMTYIILIIMFHTFTGRDLEIINNISKSSKIFEYIKPLVVQIYRYKSKVLLHPSKSF